MITANEVLIYLKNRVKTVYCGGDSRQQNDFRDRWMPKLLSEVQADFPEIAHRLTCQTAEGCDFSGFSICVDIVYLPILQLLKKQIIQQSGIICFTC